ncbi:phage head closure protein [Phyllobacterium bourgognense]|uniref:SPP1 family predicted phage head-tail adaptor n=1 Tax=Phyllobacterium bourgognense TaxID=314236 RepID=A0A368Z0J5_9HYPH|nr:phage head closure protein [Phyllobacterium bourgognense]RCW85439.1 SPP1 family predicted phage head-tail adaptor [Phyllobacterium bourgognense]
MRAGKLDKRIELQRETQIVKPSGSVVKEWQTFATIRAEVVQQSASEYLTGFGEAETNTVIFRIRYVADISTDDRVFYSGKPYDLKEIKEIGRRRGLELRCAT